MALRALIRGQVKLVDTTEGPNGSYTRVYIRQSGDAPLEELGVGKDVDPSEIKTGAGFEADVVVGSYNGRHYQTIQAYRPMAAVRSA